MKTVNVYEQYFAAECLFSGVPRRAVNVQLIAESCEGQIAYTLSLSFFPHEDPTDFSVSYDAVAQKSSTAPRADAAKSAKKFSCRLCAKKPLNLPGRFPAGSIGTPR